MMRMASVLLILAGAVTGCTVTVDGSPVADPGATTTTTTTAPTTTTTTTTTRAAPPGGQVPPGTPRTAQDVDFCALLTPTDIQQALGLTQSGPPDDSFLCTINFAEGGFVFVSEIGTSQGEPIQVEGQPAVLLQTQPDRCQVTVQLAGGPSDLLDIDARDVANPVLPLCEGVVELARRGYLRLPPFAG